MTAPRRNQHPSMSDVALALANRRSEPVQTVSITRNAKGDVQLYVEVNGPDAEAARKEAVQVFERLKRAYPKAQA